MRTALIVIVFCIAHAAFAQERERPDVIVRFRSTAASGDIRKVIEKHQLTVRSAIAEISLFVTDAPSATTIDDLLDEPMVLSAFPDAPLHATALPNAIETVSTQGTVSSGASPVNVLVLDEGFAPHDDLIFDNVCEDIRRADAADHGNHVLGIIKSPFIHLIACAPASLPTTNGSKADFSNGVGTWFSSVISKFYDVTRRCHARVVNVSLGYGWGERIGVCPDNDAEIRKLVANQGSVVRAMLAAIHEPLIVVSAAGNDRGRGRDDSCARSAQWTNPFNWAALAPREADLERRQPSENVFVVASLSAGEVISDFSNRGTIAAPGENIVSTLADSPRAYGARSGTSAAAPAISKAVARLWSEAPALSVADIRRILEVADAPR